MSKNTRNRILLTALAALLLVTLTIGGTMAWLTDNSESVTNTFLASDINVELSETQDTDNKPLSESFKMVPGANITKEPKVTVKSGSEKCWVFIKIEESANLRNFITYTMDPAWTKVETTDGIVYKYNTVVDASTGDVVIDNVLANDRVTVKDGVTKQMMTENFTNPTLAFTAYAVQSENLDSGLNDSQIWDLAKTNGAVTE